MLYLSQYNIRENAVKIRDIIFPVRWKYSCVNIVIVWQYKHDVTTLFSLGETIHVEKIRQNKSSIK